EVNATDLAITSGAKVQVLEGSESRVILVTDRLPTGTLKVYHDNTLANWNPWSLANAQSIVRINSYITGSAGQNVSLNIRAQLEYPKIQDMNGVVGYDIPFSVVPSGAGGDEYALVYS
ncbi:MAG: hypothetical protein ACYC7G_04615, partial [Rudaea sp.]